MWYGSQYELSAYKGVTHVLFTVHSFLGIPIGLVVWIGTAIVIAKKDPMIDGAGLFLSSLFIAVVVTAILVAALR